MFNRSFFLNKTSRSALELYTLCVLNETFVHRYASSFFPSLSWFSMNDVRVKSPMNFNIIFLLYGSIFIYGPIQPDFHILFFPFLNENFGDKISLVFTCFSFNTRKQCNLSREENALLCFIRLPPFGEIRTHDL